MAKTTGCIFGGFSARLLNGKNQFRPISQPSPIVRSAAPVRPAAFDPNNTLNAGRVFDLAPG